MPAVHTALRPLPWALENAMTEVMGLKPSEVAVVGDTLLTDVLPGNWLSAHTILVDPISEDEDQMTEWLSRKTGDTIAKVITRRR